MALTLAILGNMYVLSPTALATEGANLAANPVCVGPFMFDHRLAGDNVTCGCRKLNSVPRR